MTGRGGIATQRARGAWLRDEGCSSAGSAAGRPRLIRLRGLSLGLVVPAPCGGDDQRAGDGADDPARPDLEPVPGDEAEQQPADERADEARHERDAPVDASALSTEDQLGGAAHEHPEEDDGDDQHARSLPSPAARDSSGTEGAPRSSWRLYAHRLAHAEASMDLGLTGKRALVG